MSSGVVIIMEEVLNTLEAPPSDNFTLGEAA